MAAQGRQRPYRHCCLLSLSLLPALLLSPAAHAQVGSARYSSIVVEAATGRVLESDHPDALRHPASLAKLMTLYLAFEALRDRRITLETAVPVSAHAASMVPTKLGLVPGTKLTVQQAILGMVTLSANDAACALGELLGGSEERFAQMMTLRARAIGMEHTTFINASGLPAPGEWTSAADMARLARHLISDFPSYYHYFSTPSFVFHGRTIPNHDYMLRIYPGADGLKTGYTDASGHNLVTSAMRDGVRLIGVELGAGSNRERDHEMVALLNRGFDGSDVPGEGRTTRVAGRFGLIAEAHAATVQKARQTVVREQPAPASTWAIQVGSFHDKHAARTAALQARRKTENGDAHVEAVRLKHRRLWWRAQVVGLSEHEAHEACTTLAKHRTSCIILRPERPVVASR